MARSIEAIKEIMTNDFMNNETVAATYGFEIGAAFNDVFSKMSIESILFFIVASAIWTMEVLFDTHKIELTELINTKKPHNAKWYRDKVLAFQFGRSLLPDYDEYDLIVESEKVVKYCSVSEYQGRVYIKVAGGSATAKAKLTDDQKTALEAYISEIKDVGVQIGDVPGLTTVTNLNADHYSADLDIYYDPMVFAASGLRLDSGADTVRDAIKDYVQNKIPFNSEYRNVSLINVLLQLDGVVIPEFITSKTVSASAYDDAENEIPWETINAKYLPVSGYYKVYDEKDLVLNFIAYQTIESV